MYVKLYDKNTKIFSGEKRKWKEESLINITALIAIYGATVGHKFSWRVIRNLILFVYLFI